jgi:putative endonuclease
MMEEKRLYVYLMTNQNNSVLYTGVTSNLAGRVWTHKQKQVKGFTRKYNIDKLVYYEIFNDPYSAIAREKQIKAGSRIRKTQLINSVNINWVDLYQDGGILPIEWK